MSERTWWVLYVLGYLAGFMLLMAGCALTCDGCADNMVGNNPLWGEATGSYRVCEDCPNEWIVEFEEESIFGMTRWRTIHGYWGYDGRGPVYFPTKAAALAECEKHRREVLTPPFIPQCDTILRLK